VLEQRNSGALLIVPLRAGGQLLGTLNLSGAKAGQFDDEDLDLAQALAGYAATTLANQRLRDAALQADRAKSAIFDAVSHEFRTPLTSIEGYAKLLRDCESEQERNEYIDIITEETRRLADLSSGILLLSRIENENISIQKEHFRLDEQVRKVLLNFENKWQDKSIDLQLHLDSVSYSGNAQLLYQVWSNLFDNALKFSGPGGTIEIELKKADGKVVFSITDYGRGMSQEEQKRMFEKFYMGDPSRNAEGNGLGLSIVKRIVELHGGRIEVKSIEGEYTEIKVIL
jgi:signal transduction histidine kinase